MTFKNRLTLAAAMAVAVAIAMASTAVYLIVRQELRSQVDADLERIASTGRVIESPNVVFRIELPEAPLGGPPGYAQLIGPTGQVWWPSTDLLPVGEKTMAVARGEMDPYFQDMVVEGTHVRVLTAPIATGFAVQLARPLNEVDEVLQRLRWILILITLSGVALAAGFGGVVAKAALVPVRRLTRATEHVTDTSDLTHRIEVKGHDELSRLAVSFNQMLDALDESLRTQRQLVADASHELRTPLTSLRTNIEVLANEDRLSLQEKADLRSDVVDQLDELTTLIGDVVELARGKEPADRWEELDLAELVEAAAVRAEHRGSGLRVNRDLEPTIVRGVPGRLERAVNNLIDNAAKWSPKGEAVEISLRKGVLEVRDHGPGIAAEDLPKVFDRFYRSKEARKMPGSGLGLAIVRQVAEAHGGSVEATDADGGGALFRFTLPVSEGEPEEHSAAITS